MEYFATQVIVNEVVRFLDSDLKPIDIKLTIFRFAEHHGCR